MKKICAVFLACLMVALLCAPCFSADPEAAVSEEPCTSWGDLDGDGNVAAGDARLVLRQSVGLEHYTEEETHKCDLVTDGNITSADARFVLRLSVGLEQFPAHELLPVIGEEATCTTAGKTNGLYCAICEKELLKQKDIPALGHTEVIDEAVEPTCTETGLTEGKHCSVCKTVFTKQEVVPALGHDEYVVTATDTDVCREATACRRCGETLSPELKHEYAADAAVTVEKGIVCTRCGKTSIPSFNDMVNVLKSEPHTFSAFSRSDTTIDNPKYEGFMILYKSEFEKELKDSMGQDTEYTALSEPTEINSDTFEVIGSDAVSLLTDADVKSTTASTVSGIDFLSTLPDSFTASNRTYDLTAIKSKSFGDVLKVTVNVNPERYSEVADQGGAVVIDKICSSYGDMISTSMRELSSLNDDFIKCDFDCLSTIKVTYYFDRATLAPIAAQYDINLDMDQKMTIDISALAEELVSIPISLGNTGSISFDVTNTISTYCFFDEYFD